MLFIIFVDSDLLRNLQLASIESTEVYFTAMN